MSSAPTFTFWIGPERRANLERLKRAGLRLDVGDDLRAVLDRRLRKALARLPIDDCPEEGGFHAGGSAEAFI